MPGGGIRDDAVDCGPPSITLRPHRSPQSAAHVSVLGGPQQDKLAVGLAGEAVPGGGMSGDAREKVQVRTRDWTMDSGNVKIGGTGVDDVGHIVDHVTLASPNNSAATVITGEFWFRCQVAVAAPAGRGSRRGWPGLCTPGSRLMEVGTS